MVDGDVADEIDTCYTILDKIRNEMFSDEVGADLKKDKI